MPQEQESPLQNAFRTMDSLEIAYGGNPENPTPSLRVLNVVAAYRRLLIQAVADGLPDQERKQKIREGLLADAFIDPNDSEHANQQFQALTAAYANPINQESYDKWIGRILKYRRLMIEPEE